MGGTTVEMLSLVSSIQCQPFPLVYNFRLDVFSLFVNVEWSTLRRIDVLKGHDRMMSV